MLACDSTCVNSFFYTVFFFLFFSFFSLFLSFSNIHRSSVLTVLAWLVPHETAAVSASSVYTIQPCTMSLHANPHTYGACAFSCNIPPALLAK